MSRLTEERAYTLVELLVSLTLGAALVVLILQLVLGQFRLAELQAAREQVQQNARLSVELITSELRGIHAAGLFEAEPRSIGFRLPLAWGIVCAHLPGGTVGGEPALDVLFPTVNAANLARDTVNLALPPIGESAGWIFLERVADRTASELPQARASCGALEPDPPLEASSAVLSTARRYAVPQLGARLVTATPVYLYTTIRYALGTSGGIHGTWIKRNSGPAMQMHPLAGPVPAEYGLRFTYFAADGAPLRTPVVAAGPRVGGIGVSVAMESEWRNRGVPQRDSASAYVGPRN